MAKADLNNNLGFDAHSGALAAPEVYQLTAQITKPLRLFLGGLLFGGGVKRCAMAALLPYAWHVLLALKPDRA